MWLVSVEMAINASGAQQALHLMIRRREPATFSPLRLHRLMPVQLQIPPPPRNQPLHLPWLTTVRFRHSEKPFNPAQHTFHTCVPLPQHTRTGQLESHPGRSWRTRCSFQKTNGGRTWAPQPPQPVAYELISRSRPCAFVSACKPCYLLLLLHSCSCRFSVAEKPVAMRWE
jgi:hypothetical protein